MIGVHVRDIGDEAFGGLCVRGKALSRLHESTAERFPQAELVVLVTCNRAEFYVAMPAGPSLLDWSVVLAEESPGWAPLLSREVQAVVHHRAGAEVVAHLARVAAGLDSEMLGDAQILGQVRAARRSAIEHATLGPVLDGVFSAAVAAGRRARRAAGAGYGGLGVGLLVAAAIESLVAGAHRVCVIGSGDAARAVVRAIAGSELATVTVLARNRDAASLLGSRYGTGVACWDELPQQLAASDVIVTATASNSPIVAHADLVQLATTRSRLPILIDLARPANIERGEIPVLDMGALVAWGAADRPDARGVADAEHAVAAETARWLRRHEVRSPGLIGGQASSGQAPTPPEGPHRWSAPAPRRDVVRPLQHSGVQPLPLVAQAATAWSTGEAPDITGARGAACNGDHAPFPCSSLIHGGRFR